jgi:hypothetical protein
LPVIKQFKESSFLILNLLEYPMEEFSFLNELIAGIIVASIFGLATYLDQKLIWKVFSAASERRAMNLGVNFTLERPRKYKICEDDTDASVVVSFESKLKRGIKNVLSVVALRMTKVGDWSNSSILEQIDLSLNDGSLDKGEVITSGHLNFKDYAAYQSLKRHIVKDNKKYNVYHELRRYILVRPGNVILLKCRHHSKPISDPKHEWKINNIINKYSKDKDSIFTPFMDSFELVSFIE